LKFVLADYEGMELELSGVGVFDGNCREFEAEGLRKIKAGYDEAGLNMVFLYDNEDQKEVFGDKKVANREDY